MKSSDEIEVIETGKGAAEVRFNGASARVLRYQNGRYTQYGVKWKVGPKTFRRIFADRKDALHEACRVVRELDRGNREITTVHSGDILFLNECLRKVGGRNHLLSAIEFYLKAHRIDGPRKTLEDIGEELVKELESRKTLKDVSDVHIKNTKYENGVLNKWFGDLPLQNISDEMVKEKFLTSGFSKTTRRNLTRALRTRINFARRKSYVPRDWQSPLENIPLPKTDTRKPPIFTPEELMRLFIVLRPHQLLYVATMAFGGSRRAEFQRLDATHFVDEENVVCIDADIAKNPSRRTLDLRDNFKAWEDIAEKPAVGRLISKKAVVKVSAEKGRLGAVGLVWKQGILRNSFISYHLAKYRNAYLTAELAGNSVDIIKAKYKSLVTPSAAEAWFNITPISVRDYAEKQGLTHLIHW